MTDLKNMKPREEGAVLTILDPDGVPLRNSEEDGGEAWTITLMGSDSPAYLKQKRITDDRRLAQATKRGKRLKITSEGIEADVLELLGKVTISWTGFRENGIALDCSPANVLHVYQNYRFIREQVEEFIEDRAHFLGNS